MGLRHFSSQSLPLLPSQGSACCSMLPFPSALTGQKVQPAQPQPVLVTAGWLKRGDRTGPETVLEVALCLTLSPLTSLPG